MTRNHFHVGFYTSDFQSENAAVKKLNNWR